MTGQGKKGQRTNRNRWTAAALFGLAGGMVGLSFAAVPLYQLFCQVTGYGGTTQVAKVSDLPAQMSKRTITVSFDTNVARGLPWRFRPEQGKVVVHAGEEKLALFEATNTSDAIITGTASFNVTPYKAGPYFSKIECFCFTEQELKPGQRVDMPVQFFIDPEILTDPNTQDVTDIVLSYTFHPVHRTSDAGVSVEIKDERPKG